MSNSYNDPQQTGGHNDNSRDGSRSSFRGGRGPGGRESGGFRIRLSDNEMRAARSLQEAFNLRSTVAVLGFALRTLGQMLEDGSLDELKAQHLQNSRGSFRRDEKGNSGRRNKFDSDRNSSTRSTPKPNPFARPEKPQPALPLDQKTQDTNEQSEGQLSEGALEKDPSQSEPEENQEQSVNEIDEKLDSEDEQNQTS